MLGMGLKGIFSPSSEQPISQRQDLVQPLIFFLLTNLQIQNNNSNKPAKDYGYLQCYYRPWLDCLVDKHLSCAMFALFLVSNQKTRHWCRVMFQTLWSHCLMHGAGLEGHLFSRGFPVGSRGVPRPGCNLYHDKVSSWWDKMSCPHCFPGQGPSWWDNLLWYERPEWWPGMCSQTLLALTLLTWPKST